MPRHPTTARRRGEDAPAWLQGPGDRLAQALSAFGLERWARLAAALLCSVLLIVDGRFLTRGGLVLALTSYVVLTGLVRRGRYLRSADLVVAAVAAALAGPDLTAFLPFLLVAVAGTATHGGVLAGLAAGGTIAAVTVVGGLLGPPAPGVLEEGVLPLALVLPMVGLIAASAGQLVADPAVRDRLALQQANRLLSSLDAVAMDLPGGLDVRTVAAGVLTGLAGVPGARAALVLGDRDGTLQPLASTGLSAPAPMSVATEPVTAAVRRGRVLSPGSDLPVELARSCGALPAWRALTLGGGEPAAAVLLVGFADGEVARAARRRLDVLARDGGLAMDNARLFEGTQARAAASARRRIGGELHDGVAQSLAHLKLELGLLGREPSPAPEELQRLSRVADAALQELRGTIAGLRAHPDADLATRIAQHLDDLRSDRGPTLQLKVVQRLVLPPDRAEEVLRVTQEAVSNALRHAQASRITVALAGSEGTGRLIVTDDGIGLGEQTVTERTGDRTGDRPADGPGTGGGVGITSMQERAARLGGELELVSGEGGGARLVLSFPLEPPPPDGSRG